MEFTLSRPNITLTLHMRKKDYILNCSGACLGTAPIGSCQSSARHWAAPMMRINLFDLK